MTPKRYKDAELPENATATDAEMEAVESAEDAFAVLYAESAGLTDFTSYNYPDKLEINEMTGAVTLSFVESDNHFVVYNGLEERINSFVWEADVDFPDELALKCATLTFGIPLKSNPTADWYGAALDSNRHGDDAFRVFGPDDGSSNGIDLTQTLHYRVDVHANGDFVYSFGNKSGMAKTISGNIPNWRGGGDFPQCGP